jgi:hypothetical protein
MSKGDYAEAVQKGIEAAGTSATPKGTSIDPTATGDAQTAVTQANNLGQNIKQLMTDITGLKDDVSTTFSRLMAIRLPQSGSAAIQWTLPQGAVLTIQTPPFIYGLMKIVLIFCAFIAALRIIKTAFNN